MGKKKDEEFKHGNMNLWKTVTVVASGDMVDKTDAMQVTGGVIVRTIYLQGKEGVSESSVFVPNAKITEKDGIYTVA